QRRAGGWMRAGRERRRSRLRVPARTRRPTNLARMIRGPPLRLTGRFESQRLPHPSPHRGERARALLQALHQRARLLEILEELVHLGHRGAAAARDAAAAAAVDQPWRAALAQGHAEQNGLEAREL